MAKDSNLSRSEKIIQTKKNKTQKLSIFEAGFYSVSDGFGLRNIAPYALALNASNSSMGLLTSISSLIGNFSQLLTLKLLNRFTRKKVVVFSVFLQALFWLALLIPGILFLNHTTQSHLPVIILISLYASLIVSGALAGPAWNSWMKDIVPSDKLGRYFAKRNRIAGIIAFVCMIIAGLVLDHFKKTQVLYGFFILIFFSFLFRGLSGYLFTKHYEPKFKNDKKSYFSFSQFLNNMPFNNFGRFVLFMALLNFVIAIASPFFAVYLLREKGLSYTTYMILTMIMPLATITTMSYWGKISDSLGNIKIMKFTAFFIALIPFIYFGSNFISNIPFFLAFLVCMELLAGVNWGGFNLSVANFLFKSVSREKITYCSAYMNLLGGVGVFLGATIGGLLASINFWNPILLVFLISGTGRFLVYFLLLPKIKERVEEKSDYYRKGFISNLTISPRFFNHMGDIVYFKQTFNKINLSKIFNFFKN
jgi:MFS family permease